MKFRRRRDRGSLQIAVCVRGYLVGDLKCCLRDKAGVMLNCKLPPGIYAVEQCKSCVDAAELRWRKRGPSGNTTYQSVQYRTFPKAAEKVYDDGLQSDMLIYGLLRYDVWHTSRFCLCPRTWGVPPRIELGPRTLRDSRW